MARLDFHILKDKDLPQLVDLFSKTVRAINARDYTKEQIEVWASVNHLNLGKTFVAEIEGKIVGFADVNEDGFLGYLYVHKDYQRQGIAKALLSLIEKEGHKELLTEASITSKPFFEKMGFSVIRAQLKLHKGLYFKNFLMKKQF